MLGDVAARIAAANRQGKINDNLAPDVAQLDGSIYSAHDQVAYAFLAILFVAKFIRKINAGAERR